MEKWKRLVKEIVPASWGKFLRYNYLKADFSDVREEGLYRVTYGTSSSPVFRIAADVYDRGVWQPVLEYFLPVQMCHMTFRPDIDVTAIDHATHTVEIHQPDGKNDLLQQVEHGALSVVNGYLALGRLYRGIISHTLRQYVLLGDAAAMTDGQTGNEDDRWVFTEQNPMRELTTAAHLAAASRVLRDFNDTLSLHCLDIARQIYDTTDDERASLFKAHAAAELYLTTREQPYLDFLLDHPTGPTSGEPAGTSNASASSTTSSPRPILNSSPRSPSSMRSTSSSAVIPAAISPALLPA